MGPKLKFCPTCGKPLLWADQVGGFCPDCGYVGGYAPGAGTHGAGAPRPSQPQTEPASPSPSAQQSSPASVQRLQPAGGPADECPRFFNWGAFSLPFIWSLAMKLWTWAAVIGGLAFVGIILFFVFIISMVGSFSQSKPPDSLLMWILLTTGYQCLSFLINLGISVYLGVDGNRLAWKGRGLTSAAAFRAEQKTWAIIGLSVLALIVVWFVANAAIGLSSFPGMPGSASGGT